MKTIRLISYCALFFLMFVGGAAAEDAHHLFLLKFDEVHHDNMVKEEVSGKMFPVKGNFSLAEGVRGQGLKSDGFTTSLEVRNPKWRDGVNDFTMEAWVALEAYGWNDMAIFDGRNGENLDWGTYVGVNSEGYPVFGLAIEGSWKLLTGSEKIELYEWAHVSAVYDHNVGLKLYLDGKEVGTLNKTGLPSLTPRLRIARNSYDLTPDHVHRPYGAFPAKYSFDGMLDELVGWSVAKDAAAIKAAYETARPGKKPPFKQRYLPKGPETLPNTFSAYLADLEYYPEFENVWRSDAPQDIVVTFEKLPMRIVSWTGIRSAPCMVIPNNCIDNDVWVADQSAEYFAGKPRPGDTHGCAEHMSDAQCRYSRVRLIEDHAARKVIHWRYAPTDVLYKLPYFNELTGWSTWIDEYYYIYPDGVYTRGYHSFNDEDAPIDQYQETTIVNAPRTYPDDHVERAAITLADEAGHEVSYVRKENFQRRTFPGLNKPNIQLLNIKADIKPFIIMDPEAVQPMLYLWNTGINSYFSMWNHFPVGQQAPTDGRQSVVSDRTSSTAFTWMKMTKPYRQDDRKKEYVYLTGATDRNASELAALSRSWNHAPKISLKGKGVVGKGYEKFERAYLFEASSDASGLIGTVQASVEQPIENLAIRIENWGDAMATVLVDGKPLPEDQTRFGHNRTVDGTQLIVFVEIAAERPFDIVVEKK